MASTFKKNVEDVVDDLGIITAVTSDRIIGRDTAGVGVQEQLTVSGGVEFSGAGGIQSSAYTGDVTKAAGGVAQTIANDAVTYAKIQNVSATDKVLGRSTAGAGDVEEIACTAAGRALIDDATATDQRTTLGVTATGADTTYAFRANNLSDLAAPTTTARTNLGVGTGDSPQFAAVNVGAAADTTLARSGAGDLTVGGNAIYRAGGTDVPVADGGTGASTHTDGAVLFGAGSGAIESAGPGTNGQLLVGATGANAAWQTVSSGGTLSSAGEFLPRFISSYYWSTTGNVVATTRNDTTWGSLALVLTSGRLRMSPVQLHKNRTITDIMIPSHSTAAVLPTNWMFVVYDADLDLVAQTANQLTASWAAWTKKTLALTSPYVVPADGRYYVGLWVTATTPPTIDSGGAISNASSAMFVGLGHGMYNSGLTTTPPNPATLGTEDANILGFQLIGS